jgi:hypothetical protein
VQAVASPVRTCTMYNVHAQRKLPSSSNERLKNAYESRLHTDEYFSLARREFGGIISNSEDMRRPGGGTILPGILAEYKKKMHVSTVHLLILQMISFRKEKNTILHNFVLFLQ